MLRVPRNVLLWDDNETCQGKMDICWGIVRDIYLPDLAEFYLDFSLSKSISQSRVLSGLVKHFLDFC